MSRVRSIIRDFGNATGLRALQAGGTASGANDNIRDQHNFVNPPSKWIPIVVSILSLLVFLLCVDVFDQKFFHYARWNRDAGNKAIHVSNPSPPEVTTHEHRINWFAPGNDAMVNHHLTSPAYDPFHCHDGYKSKASWAWIKGQKGLCTHINPAAVALEPWSEPREHYCAPPSYGRLQLTIMLPRAISPTEIVVEHLPKGAALTIGEAPKEFELWIQVADTELFEGVTQAIDRVAPSVNEDSSDPQSTKRVESGVESSIPDDYVRVGRWTYDIWGPEHIQTFKIPVSLSDLGVKTQNIMIRVNSNWGDYGSTCIYRTRLYGDDLSDLVENFLS